MSKRPSGRARDEMRTITLEPGFSAYAEGSCMIRFGGTHVLCTASVEEVIEEHYENQLSKIGEDEKELKKKIEKFKGDEMNHKNTAYESGASKIGLYSIMDKIIRTGSKIAITISEKI